MTRTGRRGAVKRRGNVLPASPDPDPMGVADPGFGLNVPELEETDKPDVGLVVKKKTGKKKAKKKGKKKSS